MRPRLLTLAALMVVSGVLLAGCPKPNGYQGVKVFPQIASGDVLELQPLQGEPNVALAVRQSGVIERVDLADSGAQPTTFLDIRDRIIASPGQEEGLLGLAFAPDYATTGAFYVYYTRGGPRHNRISRFNAQGDHADPASEHTILDLPEKSFSNHNGGAMAFGPDGYLYVGVGDGGSGGDPNGNGQNTNTLLGKILRIDVSGDTYSIPANNPFAHGGGAPEVYAYGLRNPWRISFDAKTGQLWAGDAGQNQWEEVDRIVRGGNYGWNVMEGSHCYKPPSGCDADGPAAARRVRPRFRLRRHRRLRVSRRRRCRSWTDGTSTATSARGGCGPSMPAATPARRSRSPIRGPRSRRSRRTRTVSCTC